MSRISRLIVETPQGDAGVLEKEARFVFNYAFARDDRAKEIALGMPIRAESYASGALLPIFAMNRPEGFLYDAILRRLARDQHIDDLRLLSVVGGNQIGRLTYRLPDAESSRPRARISRQELLATSPSNTLFEYLVDTFFDSGISGVQPKVLVADDLPGMEKLTVVQPNLIVKAAGADYPHLAQNEFLCMDAARRAGIEVAPHWLSDDGGLFVTERFDLDGEQHLGFEDVTVLLNLQPDPLGHYKYTQSYEAIARVIQAFCRDGEALASRQRFFEYVALSVMVRNGDAHLKNFGLIYDTPFGRSPQIAPLYDVVTTSVYSLINRKTGQTVVDNTLAIKLRASKTFPTREELLRFGQDHCGVARPAQVLDRIADAMSESLAAHHDQIDSGFLQLMGAEWDAGRFAVSAGQHFVPPMVKLASSIAPEQAAELAGSSRPTEGNDAPKG